MQATVLLNANVAYLSVPSVQSDQKFPTLWTSAASVVSMVSMIISLGSILTGLLIVQKQNQEGYATGVINFLDARSHPNRGIEMLAIVYSLPYALLLWSMICFLGAVALTCFTVLGTIDARITRSVYAFMWGCVLALILATSMIGAEDGLREWLAGLAPVRAMRALVRTRLRVEWHRGEDGEEEKTTGRKLGLGIPTIAIEGLATEDEDEEVFASSAPLDPSSSANPRIPVVPSGTAADADAHSVRSVRSTHSRFTTNSTAVGGEGTGPVCGVRRVVRRLTGWATQLTLLVSRLRLSGGRWSRRRKRRVFGRPLECLSFWALAN